jgi:signal transduction histidine kinase
MRLTLWPQSLFGRLIAASMIALLLAQVAGMVLIARERERFILQGSVREWSRRIAEVTTMLEGMDDTERSVTVAKLSERPWRFGRRPPNVIMLRDGLFPSLEDLGPPPHPDGNGPGPRVRGGSFARGGEPGGGPLGPPGPPGAGGLGPAGIETPQVADGPGPEDARPLLLRATTYQIVVPFSKAGDFEGAFEQQLRSILGTGFEVDVAPTKDVSKRAISISGPLFSESHDSGTELYDATVKFPDGFTALFRVTRLARGAPLPRGLFMNLALLLVVMSVALFVTARSFTRPLSDLAQAADRVGRDLRQPKIAERGAREIRDAARAFNTMQDRLQRYLDSRSRVLAAMSHDLKTPLTRLRLQVEMLEDSAAQTKIGKQLDEMESMVHGALALFRGLDDSEAFTPLDVNEMLATLQSEFAEMSTKVTVEGRALRSILVKPQALRRCLTNLIANAVKFGSEASVVIEDGPALVIRVRDDGPGIPDTELERVFEPFYRLESSRNRDTGGSGLGLSIARDVAQAHGGSLVLHNLPVRGLEAVLTLPRA